GDVQGCEGTVNTPCGADTLSQASKLISTLFAKVAERLAGGGETLLHRLHEEVDREQGLGFAFSPSVDCPLGAQKLHLGMFGEIEQDLVCAAIELLRKGDQCFRAPLVSIRRAPDRDIDTLLLNNSS